MVTLKEIAKAVGVSTATVSRVLNFDQTLSVAPTKRQAIIETAKSKGCDLVVMASHGRHGISAVVLGSETVKVLTHSKIPVLVHR